jgi:hypothetical protein
MGEHHESPLAAEAAPAQEVAPEPLESVANGHDGRAEEDVVDLRVPPPTPRESLADVEATFSGVTEPTNSKEVPDPREELTEEEQRERRESLGGIVRAQRRAEKLSGIPAL